MTDWSKYPFVRMLIPFALGIWVSIFVVALRLSSTFLMVVALTLLAMSALTAFLLKHQRHSWFFGAVHCRLFVGSCASGGGAERLFPQHRG